MKLSEYLALTPAQRRSLPASQRQRLEASLKARAKPRTELQESQFLEAQEQARRKRQDAEQFEAEQKEQDIQRQRWADAQPEIRERTHELQRATVRLKRAIDYRGGVGVEAEWSAKYGASRRQLRAMGFTDAFIERYGISEIQRDNEGLQDTLEKYRRMRASGMSAAESMNRLEQRLAKITARYPRLGREPSQRRLLDLVYESYSPPMRQARTERQKQQRYLTDQRRRERRRAA